MRDSKGTWHIRAGAELRVTLEMSVPATRFHVALIDPLPAGLETLSPHVERIYTDVTPYYEWFDHQNLRDEGAEAFTDRMRPGKHRYSYIVRATTKGEFIAPPAKVEEMYHPETYGHSATDRVIIE